MKIFITRSGVWGKHPRCAALMKIINSMHFSGNNNLKYLFILLAIDEKTTETVTEFNIRELNCQMW
jgi:hypothetical protein